MKKTFTFLSLLLLILLSTNGYSQLLITEIMYNPPESGNDSLEYIEIYNAGDAVDVTGYRLEGVDYNFADGMMDAGAFLIVAINPTAFQNNFGMTAELFTGALSNGGEDVSIRDINELIIHEVVFDNIDPWPTADNGTAGEGSSIVLCDFDNPSDGASWKASGAGTGITINGRELTGSPGTTDDSGCESGPSGIIVTTSGLSFVPKDITINVGETITFTNGGGSHNANGGLDIYPSNPEGFTSGAVSSDSWEYPFTFTIPGLYDYQCDLHAGAGMVGTVTVLALPDDSDLRITEVFYNSGITPDSLEFIELYNAGSTSADIADYVLTSAAINSSLQSAIIEPGAYYVIAKNQLAFETAFPGIFNVQAWGDGTLSNSGDNIILKKADGTVVFDVTYDDEGGWPTEADGFGNSLILCDPTGNFDLENIKANNYPEVSFEGTSYFVSPGVENYCSYTIGEVSINDASGVTTSSGINAILSGTVYGINYRPGGLQFTMIDDNEDGISTFSGSEDFGYTVNEGDVIVVRGSIGEFNGLTQIYLEDVISTATESINPPTVVTELNEATESQFIKIENVSLVDPSQWNNNEFGFNVDVTDGVNTFILRIDNDVTDILTLTYPTGTFSVTGLGGQYDDLTPFDAGYQILPRNMSDIDPYNAFVNGYPPRSIGEMSDNDAMGIADSLGLNCTLVGTVHGINLRASGLQFTIIDDENDGIAVFSSGLDFGYAVNEGDLIEVKGKIDQFAGLTEIIPDSLRLLGAGTIATEIFVVGELSEFSESQLLNINKDLTLIDATQWLGDGSTFSVFATDGTIEYEILIDNDTELSALPLPVNDIIRVRGLGSQRDVSAPFDAGYRIVPRYAADIDFLVANKEIEISQNVSIYPNPARDVISFLSNIGIVSVEIYDLSGELTSKGFTNEMDVSDLTTGIYVVKIYTKEGVAIKKLIINK